MGLLNFLKSKKSYETTDALVELCFVIIQSSTALTNELTKFMSQQWKSINISVVDAKTLEFTMLAEFTYFHLAMTDRIAFQILGNKSRNDLMNQLSLTIRDIVIENSSKEWDEKSKETFKKTFKDGYNESQMRYSKGTQLIDKNEVFTGDGTLSILGREIAEINENIQDPEIVMRTIELTATSFSQMNLKLLVENLRNR